MKANVSTRDFRELASVRSRTYGFLASVYLSPPTDTSIKNLVDGVPKLLADRTFGATEKPRDVEEAVQILSQYAADQRGRAVRESVEELAVERTRLLRGIRRGYGPPPPYESVHRDSERMMGSSATDVSKLYAEAGAGLSSSLAEAPDYLGVELDFMRFACDKESLAWGEGKVNEAKRLLQLERRLLKDHLAMWVPKFCDAAIADAKTGFYTAVLKITKQVVLSEATLIEDLLDTAESVA